MNDLDSPLDDPQLKAVGLFGEREHPTDGRYIEVKPPVRFSAHEHAESSHPALTGQHTQEVVRELEA